MSGFDANDTGRDERFVEQRLHAERPEISGLRLDAIQLAVERRAASRSDIPTGRLNPMRSRLALTTMLAIGLLMASTGATVAVTGVAGNGSAGIAQYGPDGVLGEQRETFGPGGEVRGVQRASDGVGDNVAGVRQVGAQGGEESLAFTGFLAIPLLLGGVALMGVGAVLRRRARERSSAPEE